MIQNAARLVDNLRSLPDETEYVEFKHNFSDFEKEGQDISALANSAAYHGATAAYKIWGIDDKTHDVLGTSFKPRSKKKGNQGLEIWLRQHLSDNANFEFDEVDCDGKGLVILKIWPAAYSPVRFDNIAYIRTDSSTQKLKEGSTRESDLCARIQHRSFEKQAAMEDLSLEEAFDRLEREAYFDLKDIPRPTSLEAAFHYFEQDGLLASQDDGLVTITNLGALLFAKDMMSFPTVKRKKLRVARYDGKGRTANRSEREFPAGYAISLPLAYGYLEGLLETGDVIEGVQRKPTRAYAPVVIREAVVNALIHQDFTITGSGPAIEVFDDRIEVSNPGVPLVEVERIVNDSPRSRNEDLSAIMRIFHFCEEAGSGWDKIIAGCEEFRSPAPRIDTRSGESMRVTIFQPKEYRMLTPEERLKACYWHACVLYESNEYVTNGSLRERFGLESTKAAQVSRLIKDAVESNLIKPVDPKTSPKYMQYQPGWA